MISNHLFIYILYRPFYSHFVHYLCYFIEIIRITPTGNRSYRIDNKPKTKILSIFIDCADCETGDMYIL